MVDRRLTASVDTKIAIYKHHKTSLLLNRPMLLQVLVQLSNSHGTILNTWNTQPYLCLILPASCIGNRLKMFLQTSPYCLHVLSSAKEKVVAVPA